MGCCGSKFLNAIHPAPLTTPLPAVSGENEVHQALLLSLRLHKPSNIDRDQLESRFNDAAFIPEQYMCASTAGKLSRRIRGVCGNNIIPAKVDEDDFASVLQTVGKHITTNPKAYSCLPFLIFAALETPAAVGIAKEIGLLVWRLTHDHFAGADSGHSRIVIGPRGAGMTVALKRFTVVAPLLLPSLRVVYINLSSIHNGGHPAHQGLAKFLLGLDLRCEKSSDSGGESVADVKETPAATTNTPTETRKSPFLRLQETLVCEGLHLMIILDEMDVLFQASGRDARALIDEVHAFATTTSGRTSVVGCSSSCFMYSLVKGGTEVPPPLHDIFLAVKNDADSPASCALPDMNADKLQLCLISHPIPPTSTRRDRLFFVDGVTESQKRIVAFFLGNNVRHLYKRALPYSCVAPTLRLTGKRHAPVPALVRSAVEAEPLIVAVCAAMYNFWFENNKNLLSSVVAEGSDIDIIRRVDLKRIGSIDWEKSFKPLEHGSQLTAVLRQAIPMEQLNDGAGVTLALQFLEFDVALVVTYDDPITKRKLWYPESVLSVLLHHQHASQDVMTLKTFGKIAAETAKGAPQFILQKAASSTTYADLMQLGKEVLVAASASL
jgi:hypothetical protein